MAVAADAIAAGLAGQVALTSATGTASHAGRPKRLWCPAAAGMARVPQAWRRRFRVASTARRANSTQKSNLTSVQNPCKRRTLGAQSPECENLKCLCGQ